MASKLTNIVEYLALGELETQASHQYPHQTLFYNSQERLETLQEVLNQIPPIYRWLEEGEEPDLDDLSGPERNRLQIAVCRALQRHLQIAPPECPYEAAIPNTYF